MENYTLKKQNATSLIIEMETARFGADDLKKMFGKEFKQVTLDNTLTFTQEEDFIFNINTLLYLELDPGYRLLKKGVYPFEIKNEKVQILITLSPYR
jgi:hypothetical protein